MAKRTGSAVWQGDLKGGKGTFKVGSGAFEGAYSFSTRFEDQPGTNPEDLPDEQHDEEKQQPEESDGGVDDHGRSPTVPRGTTLPLPAIRRECQTVHRDTNPRYHALISAFKQKTGYPVIVNTSFNVRGEPIVCTPEDAFRCFMGTEIEVLAVGNCVLRKEDQNMALRLNYETSFEMD